MFIKNDGLTAQETRETSTTFVTLALMALGLFLSGALTMYYPPFGLIVMVITLWPCISTISRFQHLLHQKQLFRNVISTTRKAWAKTDETKMRQNEFERIAKAIHTTDENPSIH